MVVVLFAWGVQVGRLGCLCSGLLFWGYLGGGRLVALWLGWAVIFGFFVGGVCFGGAVWFFWWRCCCLVLGFFLFVSRVYSGSLCFFAERLSLIYRGPPFVGSRDARRRRLPGERVGVSLCVLCLVNG